MVSCCRVVCVEVQDQCVRVFVCFLLDGVSWGSKYLFTCKIGTFVSASQNLDLGLQ